MSAMIEPDEPANLPAVAPTGFPVSYEEAKQAIAKCESPLECRTKAQQAAAMVVYARMRDDPDLQVRAVRLQAWASRRYGELDKLLYPDRRQENLRQGSRNVVDHNSAKLQETANSSDSPRPGKRAAPTDGTTEYQRTVSRRLASIPEPEFTRHVESPTPPSVTQLANLGKVGRQLTEDTETRLNRVSIPDPGDELLKASCAALWDFAKFADTHDPTDAARTFGPDDIEMARRCVATLDQWLDRFVSNLPSDQN